jgi:hypothetical protein
LKEFLQDSIQNGMAGREIMELADNTAVIQTLQQRVDILQRKIADIQALQQQSDAELAYYRELHKLYRKVLEAEELGLGYKPSAFVDAEGYLIANTTVVTSKPTTVADAVRRIMAEHPGEKMHRLEVAKVVEERYPDMVSKTKDFEGAVLCALHVGKEKGLWSWVRSGVYKYK